MAKKVISYSRFAGGISDFTRESLIPNAFAYGRSVDVRSDPQNITILPRTIKESGSIVTDLPMWSATVPTTLDLYVVGGSGNIYKRNSQAIWSFLHSTPNSQGNGIGYFAEDNFIYYPGNTVIGRYGPLNATTPQFTDDFLGSQGGVPLNTNSLDLESSSSQYADRADTASLSVTGDLSIDVQINPESLPAAGSSMALAAKWNESGATRSYIFDILGVSGYFGHSSDGALTISADTTQSPIDSACTGSSGGSTLSATNASFVSGQVILIHQSQGSGAGTWMRNSISSYTAGTITLGTALNSDYLTGAQVIVFPQYSSVMINPGFTWNAKVWDGTVGGILLYICSGTTTIDGTISASGKGFRGGVVGGSAANGTSAGQGEGTLGVGGTLSSVANGNGGGGGGARSINALSGGGGGGGNGLGGSNGVAGDAAAAGIGGTQSGSADLTTMIFGGGGGVGGANSNSGTPLGDGRYGGNGGGIIFATSATFTISGTGAITVSGLNGGNAADANVASGGGGGGGSVLIKSQVSTLGTLQIVASGGGGGVSSASGGTKGVNGGDGAVGRICNDYLTSTSGTTTPTLNAIQDSSLVTTTTYQLRLGVSSTGSNSEYLTKNLPTLTVGSWEELGVSWQSSTAMATFYQNAQSLGTVTGTLTSIHNNASRFAVGANFNGAGTAANFYDGLIDEVRIFNQTLTADQFFAGLNSQILTTTAGLVAYYKFNGDYTDATANTNTLTAHNGPVFSSTVPFPSPTTRLDIDQQATTAGNTYTTPTAISESSGDRKTFTPSKDPQKSVAFLIAAKGSGNWTVTVHDQYNNVIDSVTIANSLLAAGYYEFVFPTVWRPLTNFTNNYHFHITSTVADGTVTTTTADDLETVSFRTYFQFLVSDQYHAVAQFLSFGDPAEVILNERYLATWTGSLYNPNAIIFEAGWRARCYAFWREFIAIGMWKGTNITDTDQGRIYFWDGISPTWNFYIDVPEGGINAMLSEKGLLNVWAGYQGDQLIYQGGDTAQTVKRLPKITTATYTEIAPGAVTMWQKLVRYGESLNTTSTEIGQGVYTWGSVNQRYPQILTFDYPISTGNYTGTNIKIGMLATISDRLLIGWQDQTGFGVDYVSNNNPPFPTASVEFLINDDDEIWKQKELIMAAANFKALNAGENVVLKYKIDDDTSWTSNTDSPTTGSIVARQQISQRYNQTEIAVDLSTSNGASAPFINGISAEVELMDGSGRVG